jgi:hypothetical protein
VQPLVIVVSPSGPVYSSSYATSLGDTERVPARTKVIDVAPPPGPDATDKSPVVVEWLRDGMLRLRWTGGDAAPREVALIVADTARQVLAAQRVLGAPYTAIFERRAGLAFVGVSVVRADGSSTLTLVPLGESPPRAR